MNRDSNWWSGKTLVDETTKTTTAVGDFCFKLKKASGITIKISLHLYFRNRFFSPEPSFELKSEFDKKNETFRPKGQILSFHFVSAKKTLFRRFGKKEGSRLDPEKYFLSHFNPTQPVYQRKKVRARYFKDQRDFLTQGKKRRFGWKWNFSKRQN